MIANLRHIASGENFDSVVGSVAPVVSEPRLLAIRAGLGAWQAASLDERLGMMRRVLPVMSRQVTAMARTGRGESGRSESEVLVAQVLPLIEAVKYLVRQAPRDLATRRVGGWRQPFWLWGHRAMVSREPWGIVLILGPRNYPLMLPGIQVMQALTAGNAVILKPGQGGRAAATLMKEILVEAGMDERLLTCLPDDCDAGRRALNLPVHKVIFTGSFATGTAVLNQLAARAVPAAMELSGCDTLYVRSDADIELAARAVEFGLGLNAGGTCMAPRRLLVHRDRRAEFEARLGRVATFRYSTMPELAGLWRDVVDAGRAGGADLICGMVGAGDTFRVPMVLSPLPANAAVWEWDTMGPIAFLTEVDGDDEALAVDCACPYALGVSIFTRDVAAGRALARRFRAGVVTLNDVIVPSADPRLPFLGRGRSGFGATRGAEGLRAMTVPKVTTERRRPFHWHLRGRLPAAHLLAAYARYRCADSVGDRFRFLVDFVLRRIRQ